MSKKEKFAKPWKELAQKWELYTYPGRPSKNAVTVYKKYVRECVGRKKSAKALVLGATPEVRDLLHDLGLHVIIIDLNMEMILAMTDLMKHSADDEVLVRGSWTDMPFKDDAFDVVVGDLVLPNVPVKLHKKFLGEIQRVLKPQSCFITKQWMIPNAWVYKNIEDVIEIYQSLPTFRNGAMEMFCHMLASVWDPETKICDSEHIRKMLSKYRKGDVWNHPNKKVKKMLEEIWAMWAPLDKVWVYYTEAGTEKVMAPYFHPPKKILLRDCKLDELDDMIPLWSHKVKK